MRLYKEYLSRHKINIPVVQYDRESLIFLRSKSDPVIWRIICFLWKHAEHHPGYFEYCCLAPVHNGGSDCFDRIDIIPLHWDEYERGVLKIVEEFRDNFRAISYDDHFISAWKMFLFTCDFKLSQTQIDHTLIESSIRPDINNLEQLSKQQEVESLLESKISRVWRSQFIPLASIHSKWLEILINK